MKKNNVRSNLWLIVKYLIILNVLVFIISNVFCLGLVSGNSMLPTYKNKELIGIYRFHPDIEKNDVVSFKYGEAQQQYANEHMDPAIAQANLGKIGDCHIKRVVGTPGDQITITAEDMINSLFINNQLLLTFAQQVPAQSYQLGADEYFVLGDNRDVSFDSLYHGPITKNEIIGEVVFKGPVL